MNDALKAYNLRLDFSITANLKTGKLGVIKPVIATSIIEPKARKEHIRVQVDFCPFCGEKYPEVVV
jgi:predicted molibdopterin-dependent oxidoreductase YjgC